MFNQPIVIGFLYLFSFSLYQQTTKLFMIKFSKSDWDIIIWKFNQHKIHIRIDSWKFT